MLTILAESDTIDRDISSYSKSYCSNIVNVLSHAFTVQITPAIITPDFFPKTCWFNSENMLKRYALLMQKSIYYIQRNIYINWCIVKWRKYWNIYTYIHIHVLMYLITRSTSTAFNYSRYNFLQVVNVSVALRLAHLWPERFNAVHQLILGSRLPSFPQKMFQFMPYKLYWIQVRAFRRGFPPVDASGFIKFFGLFACMLRVVVLHKTVAFWINVSNKWKEM